MRITPRKAVKTLVSFLVLFLLAILYSLLYRGNVSKYTDDELRLFMTQQDHNGDVLTNLFYHEKSVLNFFSLPKRKFEVSYSELTSANRDTSAPLAPDFTFLIEYRRDSVLFYEDQGPGCVYRIYLFPNLPTDSSSLHQLVNKDLHDSMLLLHVDGTEFWFHMDAVMDGKEWPFLSPFNTQHPKPASGVGIYTPICYNKEMKISYHPSKPLPANLFQQTVNCTLNGYYCTEHIYTAVSRHKYPSGTKVKSFALADDYEDSHQTLLENAASLLEKPEIYGPDSGMQCTMDCIEVCEECRRQIFKSNSAGVISALKIRVFDPASATLLTDWNKILITVQMDDVLEPQLDRVPIGSLMGVTASLNEFPGATAGHMPVACAYTNKFAVPNYCMTGYFYFPMPYWKKAIVFLEGASGMGYSQMVCYDFSIVKNFYDEPLTGYFHAAKTYYGSSTNGWREVLNIDNQWGHIVGLLMEVDNLKAQRNVPLSERWALLQADAVIHLDGAISASILGTGFEDYFSYAHGFAFAENTTYAFVGVHHSAPRRSEPLSWHCYRFHVLDPIIFTTGIRFLMEGTMSNYHSQEQQVTYEEHRTRLDSDETSVSHLILYYSKPRAGGTITDAIIIGDDASQQTHSFRINGKGEIPVSQTFKLSQKRYLGNVIENKIYEKEGVILEPGDTLEFTLKISTPNKGLILRREFYTPVGKWNERAVIKVNGVSQGEWFIPMGSLNEKYVLREEDLLISSNVSKLAEQINVEIKPLSEWRDIAYHVMVLH